MSRSFSKGLHDISGKSRDSSLKGAAGPRARAPLPDRAVLSRYRVIQRDLIYVIGIPIEIATEENLNKFEYFGQYGPIKKIVVNNSTVHTNNTFQRPTVSAYVTFKNIEDAWECLYALENFSIGGHLLKASFGTSKYCSSFLSGQKCNKPDCMYLHHIGDPEDSFGTDEIQQNSQRFIDMTRPLRSDNYDDYEFADSTPTVFPPRRILTKDPPKPKENENRGEFRNEPLVEQEATKESQRNAFLNNLFSNSGMVTKPLNVNYSVGQSLNDQLTLSRPSIRSIFQYNTK